MKFTTLIPTTRNDGTPVDPVLLHRWIESLWRPFRAMTRQDGVMGHWIDEDGMEFRDLCIQIAIDTDRSRLAEAARGVRRIGRKLGQRAMYFEVEGYDGVQILRVD